MLPFAFAAPPQQAQIVPAEVQADDVSFDPRAQALEVKGNVRVDASPFHLRSERLMLRRSWRGLELEGKGRLAFCPCLGTPLTIAFDEAAVAPPGDLVLHDAALYVYRVPIFWLPVFWLRSPARIGLLPPDVAYRGVDGVYAGAGVHVPLRAGDAARALDVRTGAYFKGGMVLDGRLRTSESTTRVRWDFLREAGTTFDARGSFVARELGVAWDVDAIRGARGLLATTDLEPAARRWDRAGAEAAVRADGWTLAASVRAVAPRGGSISELGAIGPVITARNSGSAGGAFTYDVGIDGGQVRGEGLRALSFARGEMGLAVATTAGPLGLEARARGAGDLVADGQRQGVDGVAWGRAQASLPVGRAYASSEPSDPWLHRVEPRVGVSGATAHVEDLIGARPGRGAAGLLRGEAWMADVGLTSALGRWGARDGFEIDGGVGVADVRGYPRGLARWRAAARGRMVGAGAEGAHLVDGVVSGSPPLPTGGHAALLRTRVGPAYGLHVAAAAAFRDGIDPVLARLVGDPSVDPGAGFLSAEGWTAGGRVSVPWWSLVTTTAGADFDLDRRQLVGARAGVEIRDRCRCLVVRTAAAHRIGRDGVDVWITIDLAP